MTPEQIRIYKAMSPAQKLALALKFCHDARELKTRSLASLHPDWSDEQIRAKVRELFLRAVD